MSTNTISHVDQHRAKRSRVSFAQQEEIYGWMLVVPWIFGFLVFIAGPMIASVYLAFTDWDILTSAEWVGLENFSTLIFEDASVWQALKVTTTYAFVSIPLQIILGLSLALLLNEKIKAMSLIRTVFYLPSVVSGVAVALLWRWIFSPDFGLLNVLLGAVGIQGPAWLADSDFALSALIIMSLWGVGGGMIIFLAGLQSVPTTLYEAAEVDGANLLRRFWNITLPMISPVILFQTIIGIIAALQTFTEAFIMTQGGPKEATLFLMLYLYQNAFQFLKMGYASSLAWVLFIYIMALTLIVLKSSSAWVYYEGVSNRGS